MPFLTPPTTPPRVGVANEAQANDAASHKRFEELLASISSEHTSLWRQCQSLARENEELRAHLSDKGNGMEDIWFPHERNLQSFQPLASNVLKSEPSSIGKTRPASALLSEPRYTPAEPTHESSSALQEPTEPMPAGFFKDDLGFSTLRSVSFKESAHEHEDGGSSPVSSPKSVQQTSRTSSRLMFGSTTTGSSARSKDAGQEEIVSAGSATSSLDHLAALPSLKDASRDAICRLMVRLGILRWESMVSGHDLYMAVTSLGLEKFSEAQMEAIVNKMCAVSGLFAGEFKPVGFLKSHSMLDVSDSTGHSKPSLLSKASQVFTSGSSLNLPEAAVPFQVLANFLVSDRERKRLGTDMAAEVLAIKEVLLSGEANRLVADLTRVRVDDLAAPPPRMDIDTLLEPLVGFMIVSNGICLGLQTDPHLESWSGWAFIESGFTLFFIVEMCLRIWVLGLYKHFCGPEALWSWSDAFIVLAAVADTIIVLSSYNNQGTPITLMRTLRLARLCRLIRIFRLGFLRELNIMVRGLLAGFRTLFWAIVLLFVTIYILAICATMTVGTSDLEEKIIKEELFSSVPRAMLTCFRCFVGDCTTSRGEPIVKLLSDAHGVVFVLAYLASFTMVTLGLFNLIMAIYVEITMAAAKRTEEKDKHRQMRESLRVAHVTKKLLKKFCSAQSLVNNKPTMMNVRSVSIYMKASEHGEVDDDANISKDLFLLVVQDPEVQHLMDALDIPPDRADLFDILDADGSGGLHVTELVHGLLKVRGEARKSDVIASLLAVRAVQDMIRLFEEKVMDGQEQIMNRLGVSSSRTPSKSIWDMGYRKSDRSSVREPSY